MTVCDELREQPATVQRLLRDGIDAAAQAAAVLARPDIEHVIVAGRGTSDNAARYAQYLWGARNGLPVTLAAPSLFGAHERHVGLGAAAIVVISQSGRSPDLLAVADAGRRQSRPVIVITNDDSSPLADKADHLVPLHAGAERAVAATKTYTASLVAVAMISEALNNAGTSILVQLPDLLRSTVELPGPEVLAGVLGDQDRCIVLGRGWHLATAFEWALKLQELSGIVAQPWSTADFEHGPIAAVDEGFPVLAVSVEGPTHPEMCRVITRLTRELGARTLMITDDSSGVIASEVLPVPHARPAWLSPIVVAPLIQRFAIAAAIARGKDPDEPAGLQKITRTR
jgi:glutamine---fructose-6-phosphate transaminase (isomerizing)